jgi:hypothetical protein
MATTIAQAKKIMVEALKARNLPFTKLSAKTVDFTDLARCECIFVRIHGWQPSPEWSALKAVAKANGFCIET